MSSQTTKINGWQKTSLLAGTLDRIVKCLFQFEVVSVARLCLLFGGR
jgi:hypothetical protein